MDDTPSRHDSGLALSLDHTLPEVIAHVAERHGDATFIVGSDGTKLSFSSFGNHVATLARALIAHDVAFGDRVAIWAPNSREWIIAASAVESIGAILVPINTRFKANEAAFARGKTRARVLFTVSRFLGNDYPEMLRTGCGGATEERPVRDLQDLAHLIRFDGREYTDFSQRGVDEAELEARIASVRPDTIADILFTSGTTDQPKGAMHNHGQAMWMPAVWNQSNELRAGDRMALVNPFFHSFGYRSGWVSALIAGITAYPLATFDPEQVLKLIENERISVLMGPPTIFFSLMEHPLFYDYDISSLRVGHTGASNVPVELIRAGHEVFGFDIFLTSFGQTEATALVTVNTPADDLETLARTVGRPLPGVEIRISDADGRVVSQGGSGELLVRGPNVMQGYFEELEQTSATIDPDGWLHTGDVGCIDANGCLRILDRLKDVVIVGGFNAYPAEIENVLREHPAIAEVSVIGWPDDRMGEVCAACAILRPGQSLALEELVAWSREQMANYKVPRHLFIVDDFPRTPLGKVQKFALRDRIRQLLS